MYTLEELWNNTYEEYRMTFDNKGNFKEGRGIIPYSIIKRCEGIIKNHIRKSRKNNIVANVLYNKKVKDVANIKIIK